MTMAKGMTELQMLQGEAAVSSEFVDGFLDTFLLNRLGSNVLMSQYIVGVDQVHPDGRRRGVTKGVVDLECDPAKICREVAEEVQDVCLDQTGLRPQVRVEAHSACGEDRGIPRFPYIPSFLKYMMSELLKNSCKATCRAAAAASGHEPGQPVRGSAEARAELSRRPILIVVCADETHIAIRVSDRARGIPFAVGNRVWSYLYSTARRGPTELSGYGVGLPLSRLYARYLGGSLDLISMPGFGTDAYLMLPRLEASMMEVVPDNDHEYAYTSLATYAL
uniref:Protein-serine/threonine kinase n=1 Tax=Zooxanthella nutricula TaxID=1333877 RepID=A0A7S2Q1D3_9DINO|mmetsp:Transcript_75427/g.230696  ORF Transcript_75427/g.230696 Transcript_75427/m.230696 type:complete len:278 (+) Transcript_75427:3-836(+)